MKGFEPVYDKNSEILILGSFPSVISREVGFYYGNRRNRFWSLLGKIFREEIGENVDSKKAFLLKHGIALWDIAESCDVKGSSDSEIKNVSVVDLDIILNVADIGLIICNGKKSYEIFSKNYDLPIKSVCLPSTSPANVSFDESKWFDALGALI